jgi:hypothetical protein
MQAQAGCLAGYYLVGEGLPFDRALARCCVQHDLNPIVIGLANRKPMCRCAPLSDLNR